MGPVGRVEWEWSYHPACRWPPSYKRSGRLHLQLSEDRPHSVLFQPLARGVTGQEWVLGLSQELVHKFKPQFADSEALPA